MQDCGKELVNAAEWRFLPNPGNPGNPHFSCSHGCLLRPVEASRVVWWVPGKVHKSKAFFFFQKSISIWIKYKCCLSLRVVKNVCPPKKKNFVCPKMVTVIFKQVAFILCTLGYCTATLKAHVYTPAHKGSIFAWPAVSGYANISHAALFGCFFGLCDYWQARYSDDHIIT